MCISRVVKLGWCICRLIEEWNDFIRITNFAIPTLARPVKKTDTRDEENKVSLLLFAPLKRQSQMRRE